MRYLLDPIRIKDVEGQSGCQIILFTVDRPLDQAVWQHALRMLQSLKVSFIGPLGTRNLFEGERKILEVCRQAQVMLC
jgi:hypothetical protein